MAPKGTTYRYGGNYGGNFGYNGGNFVNAYGDDGFYVVHAGNRGRYRGGYWDNYNSGNNRKSKRQYVVCSCGSWLWQDRLKSQKLSHCSECGKAWHDEAKPAEAQQQSGNSQPAGQAAAEKARPDIPAEVISGILAFREMAMNWQSSDHKKALLGQMPPIFDSLVGKHEPKEEQNKPVDAKMHKELKDEVATLSKLHQKKEGESAAIANRLKQAKQSVVTIQNEFDTHGTALKETRTKLAAAQNKLEHFCPNGCPVVDIEPVAAPAAPPGLASQQAEPQAAQTAAPEIPPKIPPTPQYQSGVSVSVDDDMEAEEDDSETSKQAIAENKRLKEQIEQLIKQRREQHEQVKTERVKKRVANADFSEAEKARLEAEAEEAAKKAKLSADEGNSQAGREAT